MMLPTPAANPGPVSAPRSGASGTASADAAAFEEMIAGLLARGRAQQVVLWSALPQVPRTNLALLRYFLQRHHEDQQLQGLYVAVDRPLRYVLRLLDKHTIPRQTLTFLDGIGGLSAEGQGLPNPEISVLGPTTPFALAAAIDDVAHTGPEVDFVLVDNLSSLLNFLSTDAVAEVLDGLLSLQGLNSRPHIIITASQHNALGSILPEAIPTTISIQEDRP